MRAKTPAKRRVTRHPRHTFTIKERLIGKMGPGAYGRLLERMRRVAR